MTLFEALNSTPIWSISALFKTYTSDVFPDTSIQGNFSFLWTMMNILYMAFSFPRIISSHVRSLVKHLFDQPNKKKVILDLFLSEAMTYLTNLSLTDLPLSEDNVIYSVRNVNFLQKSESISQFLLYTHIR